MSPRALRGLGAVTLAAAFAVWLLLNGLAWPARALATFLLVPLPILQLVQARMVDRVPEDAEREAVYISSAASIWLLAALAMLAARFGDLTRDQLGLATLPPATLLLAAGLTILGGVLIMAVGRLLRIRETALVEFLIPQSGTEKIAFLGLSISAGIAEELVFRSFLIPALALGTGSLGLAATLSIAAFAASHAYQGWTGTARVAILGTLLTIPFLVTGSIYPSMIAHAAIDILSGLILADWLKAGDA